MPDNSPAPCDIAFARVVSRSLQVHVPEGLRIGAGPGAMLNARTAGGLIDRFDLAGWVSSAEDAQWLVGNVAFALDQIFERFSELAQAFIIEAPPHSRATLNTGCFGEVAHGVLSFGWRRTDGWRLTLGSIPLDVPREWAAINDW